MKTKLVRRIRNNLRETLANKVCALVLLTCGWLMLKVSGDGTSLVFLGCLAVPMFIDNENWIF